jgi:predicted aspartyl protease
LVDTGADYLQLPSSAATSVGLGHLLASAVATNVKVAGGGYVIMYLAHGVNVTIEGIPVTVSVLFDSSNSGPVLLGRQALLAAVEAGFNTTEWLYT